ncbi:helicase [Patescibacteria group bacterium]|nr:helicase [Patescibacteria group bacterium]
MSHFITNKGNATLKARLVELINSSKQLKFLVGFFYFSGLHELYKSLKNNPGTTLDVLIGLTADRTIHGIIEVAEDNQGFTQEERFENFLEAIRKSLNHKKFDTQEFYEQITFFIKLIKEGKLRIRKTRNPNHAKLYIFKMKKEQSAIRPSIFITGSSNLTSAGLSDQEELNVEIGDFGTEQAEKHFDELWEDAHKITEIKEFKVRVIEVIQRETLVAEVTPFEAYAFTLKNYLDTQSKSEKRDIGEELLNKKGYKSYKYQLDAVAQALNIIDKAGGVIIADVVGLGKSVIASLVAKKLGHRGIIICPPALKGNSKEKDSGWEKYKEDFELYDWEIFPCGVENLERALNFIKKRDEIKTIIVDEVHRFRNQDTEAHELLSAICQDKKVMLLSATPFNNSPKDLLSILKLFIVPGKSTITLDNDLNTKFKIYDNKFKRLSNIRKNHASIDKRKRDSAIKDYESIFSSKIIDVQKVKIEAKNLSKRIKQDIEPVVIRRNRIDLQKDPEYSQEVYNLSEIKNPKEILFALSEKQMSFYDEIIKDYFGEKPKFKGAIYKPFEYEQGIKDFSEEQLNKEKNRELLMQRNLYDFMRRLLIKRFESSFGAFEKSIKNFYNITDKAGNFARKTDKFILDRSLMEKMYEMDADEIEEELKKFEDKIGEGNYPKQYKIYELKNFKAKGEFLKHIESDKKVFKEILEKLAKLDLTSDDPKFKATAEEIEKILKIKNLNEPQRKIIIFTEYADTVEYLEDKLEAYFPNQVLTIKGSISSGKIKELLENFDAGYENKKDIYKILLATDKISEGFNLNKAGAVINYDIPWNPTRVIQRVGRINRIGEKVFNDLYIYNCFPTVQGAEYVKSREIAANKMFLIHNALGEDAKIFDTDEEPAPSALFAKINQNPEKQEEETWHTAIRRKYREIEENHPEVLTKIKRLPPRIKSAKQFKENVLLVFFRKGTGFFVRAIRGKGNSPEEPLLQDAFEIIECKKSEKLLSLSNSFWDNYDTVKEYKDITKIPASEQSLEKKARNNLNTLIAKAHPEAAKLLPFIKTLLEDVREYKTLSEYTLRRIVKLKTENPNEKEMQTIIKEVGFVRDKLGEDYLDIKKATLKDVENELIIAIENTKK